MEALYDVLVFHPIITIPFASKKTGLSQPTMTKAIQDMEALEVLIEITGKRRGKVYLYPLLYVLDDLKLWKVRQNRLFLLESKIWKENVK